MLTVSSSKFWATVAVLPILLFSSGNARAEAPWTAVGSTGVADEADLQMFSFNNGQASVSSSVAAPATLNLRYNIVGIDDLASNFTSGSMRVRFLDNGSGAQVLLSLKAYNHDAGTVTTLATFDSNNSSSSSSYQVRSVCFPLNAALDFSENAYFIDAQLVKSSTSGTPALGTISLYKSICGL